MKIKFIKPHFQYSYFPGDPADLEDEIAEKLIAGGFAIAEKASEKPAKGKESDPQK